MTRPKNMPLAGPVFQRMKMTGRKQVKDQAEQSGNEDLQWPF